MNETEFATRKEFEELKESVRVNTVLTLEVHSILVNFRTFGNVVRVTLKWVTAIGAAIAAVMSAFHMFK